MEGVDEDLVDWRDNYSGDTKEPIVMPSAVPNLLANGAQGIAVGMATSFRRTTSPNFATQRSSHRPSRRRLEALATLSVQISDRRRDDRRQATIIETYRRPRRLSVDALDKEDTGRGGSVAVVNEIPTASRSRG